MNLVEELAREAGFVDYELDDGTTAAFDRRYTRFAALVAERCAQIIDRQADRSFYDSADTHLAIAAREIRAAFQPPL